jgi:hypothetical protein
MAHEMGVAAAHLGNEPMGNKQKGFKPLKEMHVKELHDGTYHVAMHHGRDHHGMELKPPTEGSAQNIDGVHEHLHGHFAGGTEVGEKGGVTKDASFYDGEAGGEKKQGRTEKPKEGKVKATSEKDEKPEHGKTEEGGEKAEEQAEE